MKYRVQIEADLVVTLQDGDIEDVGSYIEQIGYDCVHVPDTYRDHVVVDFRHVDWEEEKDA